MELELNTVKPGSKKAYIVGTSFMLRDRQGDGDEQSGKNFAVGTLREAKKIAADLKRTFDQPWTEQHGSRTVGYHNEISIRQVFVNEYDDFDAENDRTWGSEKEVFAWSNEKKIPW